MEKYQEYNQEKCDVDIYCKENVELLEGFEYRNYNWLRFLKVTHRILYWEYALEGKENPVC